MRKKTQTMKIQKTKSVSWKISIEFFIKVKEKVMNTHFKTQYNRSLFPGVYEVNKQPSMTIPDQSMSVKTILDRFARGLPLGGSRVPVYDGEDDDMPDMARLDLAERQEIIENAKEELVELQKKVLKNKELREAAVKEKAEKAAANALKAYKKELEDKSETQKSTKIP